MEFINSSISSTLSLTLTALHLIGIVSPPFLGVVTRSVATQAGYFLCFLTLATGSVATGSALVSLPVLACSLASVVSIGITTIGSLFICR